MPKVFVLVVIAMSVVLGACSESDGDDIGAWGVEGTFSQDAQCPIDAMPADDPADCGAIEMGCGEGADGAYEYDADCGCVCEASTTTDPTSPSTEPTCPEDAIPADAPADCAALLMGCGDSPNGAYGYDEDCGCICDESILNDPVPEPKDSDCPDDTQGYHYLGNSPDECADIDFSCDTYQEGFDNECGCGCRDVDDVPHDECPAEDDGYRYISTDPDQCAVIFFSCEEGEQHFDDPECGCGCYDPEADQSPSQCVAQEAVGVGQPCPGEPLYAYDGQACVEIGGGDDYCFCEGADCEYLPNTRQACEANIDHCMSGGCEPMDVEEQGGCDLFVGWAYQGGQAGTAGCVPISCECIGADCGALYDELDACIGDHQLCPD